jgi:YVTN family beta-propeller protein
MYGLAVNAKTHRIYVANSGSNTIYVFDADTGVLLTDIALGYTPFGVAVNPQNNGIYVTNLGSQFFSVIDGSTNSISIPIAVPEFPSGASIIWIAALVFAISITRKGRFAHSGRCVNYCDCDDDFNSTPIEAGD